MRSRITSIVCTKPSVGLVRLCLILIGIGLMVTRVEAVTLPTSPAAWYKADAGINLSGGIVTGWEDQSGNGWNLSLTEGDATLNQTALNGMPAVTFDGNDVFESAYNGEPATIFVVGKTTAGEGLMQSWAGGHSTNASASSAWRLNAIDDGAGTGRSFSRTTLSGSTALLAGGEPEQVIRNKAYLQAGRLDASTGTAQLYKQGYLEAAATGDTSWVGIDKMAIGASYAGNTTTGHLVGEINEVLIYDRVLSDSEMADVQAYLTRWFGGDPTQNHYIGASWVGDKDQNLYILQSEDAQTFTGAYASLGPLGNDVVRDPSIMYDHNSGEWWIAYTTGHWSTPTTYFGLARSKDGVFWDNVARVDTSSVAQGDPRTFAPEWIKAADGWHVVVGLSSDGGSHLEMYELHPTDESFLNWSDPERLTGLQPNVVDGMLIRRDGAYQMWYTDRSTAPWSNVLASADNLTGPWTPDPELQGNWYPVQTAVEAPYVVQIEGDHWRMYFDQPGGGTKLIPGVKSGIYIDSYDGMRTWGPPAQIDSPAKRHLSIMNLDLTGPGHLPGDLNGDGYVGLDDLALVLDGWNQSVPPADPRADPSGDGYVGLDDLGYILDNWNVGIRPGVTAHIPEPHALWLLMIGASACVRRQGRA